MRNVVRCCGRLVLATVLLVGLTAAPGCSGKSCCGKGGNCCKKTAKGCPAGCKKPCCKQT